ncbi:MAG: ABC transporter permease, partial [bacterium]
MHADIIPVERLFYALIPALIVVGIQYRWSMDYKNSLLALLRMLVQLLMIGFALSWLFAVDQPLIVLLILAVMLLISSWIALRTISSQRNKLFWYALLSIVVGGASTLLVMVLGVLAVDHWMTPQYIIPLAGMF